MAAFGGKLTRPRACGAKQAKTGVHLKGETEIAQGQARPPDEKIARSAYRLTGKPPGAWRAWWRSSILPANIDEI
jgi:hypothetical protein